jgi:hypothetical protein
MNIAANSELRIRQALVTKDEICVSLMDGRVVSVPLAPNGLGRGASRSSKRTRAGH